MSDLEKCYEQYLRITDTMVEEYGGMVVAGVMQAQALSIYKTALSPSEFNSMVDDISASRDKVPTFDGPSIQ